MKSHHVEHCLHVLIQLEVTNANAKLVIKEADVMKVRKCYLT